MPLPRDNAATHSGLRVATSTTTASAAAAASASSREGEGVCLVSMRPAVAASAVAAFGVPVAAYPRRRRAGDAGAVNARAVAQALGGGAHDQRTRTRVHSVFVAKAIPRAIVFSTP